MTTTETAAQWGTLVGIFLVALMTQWHAWKSRKQANSAVEEARIYVNNQTQRMRELHGLVNGAMGNALRTIMILSQDKAAATNHPTDVAAAEMSRQQYEDHMEKQRMADANRESYKAGQMDERNKSALPSSKPSSKPPPEQESP